MPKTLQKISHPPKKIPCLAKKHFCHGELQSVHDVSAHHDSWNLNSLLTTKFVAFQHLPQPGSPLHPTALVGGPTRDFVYIMSCHVSLRINPSSSRALKVPFAGSFDADKPGCFVRKRFGKKPCMVYLHM